MDVETEDGAMAPPPPVAILASRGDAGRQAIRHWRQERDLARMIWSRPEMTVRLFREVRLTHGDPIFTGAPAGVASVERGDQLEREVEGVGSAQTKIA